MLAIALNHVDLLLEPLGFSQQNIPTLTALGYSSTASLFFALSGYMIGLIYLRRPGVARALGRRLTLIYLVNGAAFLAGLAVVLWFPPQSQDSFGYAPIIESPVLGLGLFLAMLRQPALLDVLHMYVILMLATPLVAFVMTKGPLLAVLVCACIYTVSLVVPEFSLPAAVLKDGDWNLQGQWNMDVLSWQLLFFGAMWAGTVRLHEKLFDWVEKSASLRRSIIALFALVAVVKAGDTFGYWGAPPLVDKRTLAPMRLMHAGLTLALLCSLIVMLAPYLQHPLARLAAVVGRQTLYCFGASIPATYLAASLWSAGGGTYIGYLLSCLFVLAVVVGVAFWADTWRSRRRKDLPEGPLRALDGSR